MSSTSTSMSFEAASDTSYSGEYTESFSGVDCCTVPPSSSCAGVLCKHEAVAFDADISVRIFLSCISDHMGCKVLSLTGVWNLTHDRIGRPLGNTSLAGVLQAAGCSSNDLCTNKDVRLHNAHTAMITPRPPTRSTVRIHRTSCLHSVHVPACLSCYGASALRASAVQCRLFRPQS